MLVLSRRIGEEIVFGDNVRVVVVGNTGSIVRLGVVAPRSIAVDRKEIADRRLQERLAQQTSRGSVAQVEQGTPNES